MESERAVGNMFGVRGQHHASLANGQYIFNFAWTKHTEGLSTFFFIVKCLLHHRGKLRVIMFDLEIRVFQKPLPCIEIE